MLDPATWKATRLRRPTATPCRRLLLLPPNLKDAPGISRQDQFELLWSDSQDLRGSAVADVDHRCHASPSGKRQLINRFFVGLHQICSRGIGILTEDERSVQCHDPLGCSLRQGRSPKSTGRTTPLRRRRRDVGTFMRNRRPPGCESPGGRVRAPSRPPLRSGLCWHRTSQASRLRYRLHPGSADEVHFQ